MTNTKLYVDIHAIETVPPSNLNRDDTGSPKTAVYGGVTRSRVSSQSWKKVIREYFVENLDKNELGVRTLELPAYLAGKIKSINPEVSDEDAQKKADELLKNLKIKTTDSKESDGKKHKVLKALFFMGDEQANKLAQAALEGNYDNKELRKIMKDNPAVDISLFGRMVADDPNLNTDASAQVSHAISTHAVNTEFDFFTATDDFSTGEHAGAGMLGTTEYNSSTLYRYANVSAHDLLNQLGDSDKTAKAIRLFVEGFVKSMPTGKINTFANETLPQALIVTIRNDRPVNLVTGFEKPVYSNDGFVEKSVERMANELEKANRWVNKPEQVLTIGIDKNIGDNFDSLDELLGQLSKNLESLL